MTIQSYSDEHFDGCIALFHSNLDKYFAPFELPLYEQYLQQKAAASGYLVLLHDGKVVAAGGYSLLNDSAWLDWGMVDRSQHGKGYGRTLTDYRLEQIKAAHGAIPIKICTTQHTLGFYEKFGFVVQSVEENGYKPGLHKYLLCRESS